jgi:hypothetical protein
VSSDRRGIRYAGAAIANAAKRVASAPQGQRNSRLNAETFGLWRFVGLGLLDPQQIADAMTVAALQAGLGRHEIVATIESALNAGLAKSGQP